MGLAEPAAAARLRAERLFDDLEPPPTAAAPLCAPDAPLSPALLALARALEAQAQGQLERAAQLLDEALAIDPQCPEAALLRREIAAARPKPKGGIFGRLFARE